MVHGCVFSLLSTQEDFQGRISAASGGYVFCLFVYSRSHSLDLAGAKGVDFVSGGSTETSCLISRKQSFRFIGISPQQQQKKNGNVSGDQILKLCLELLFRTPCVRP